MEFRTAVIQIKELLKLFGTGMENTAFSTVESWLITVDENL
jgi:hypothetical protein